MAKRGRKSEQASERENESKKCGNWNRGENTAEKGTVICGMMTMAISNRSTPSTPICTYILGVLSTNEYNMHYTYPHMYGYGKYLSKSHLIQPITVM